MFDLQKTLAKNLKQKRKLLGYSQEKLAEVAGVQRNTVSYIENASKMNISYDTIHKLCECLNVSPVELFMPEIPQNQNDKLYKIYMMLSSFDDEKLNYVFKFINSIK